MVFRRYTQQFGDHGRWQGQRVAGDQLGPALAVPFAFHGIEEFFAERLDPPPQPFDKAGGERLGNEGTQPRVVRVVQVEHVAFERLEESRDPRCLRPLIRVHSIQLILGECVILQHTCHILIAGNQPRRPTVAKGHAPNGSLGLQAGVERIGVGFEGRAGEVTRNDPLRAGSFHPTLHADPPWRGRGRGSAARRGRRTPRPTVNLSPRRPAGQGPGPPAQPRPRTASPGALPSCASPPVPSWTGSSPRRYSWSDQPRAEGSVRAIRRSQESPRGRLGRPPDSPRSKTCADAGIAQGKQGNPWPSPPRSPRPAAPSRSTCRGWPAGGRPCPRSSCRWSPPIHPPPAPPPSSWRGGTPSPRRPAWPPRRSAPVGHGRPDRAPRPYVAPTKDKPPVEQLLINLSICSVYVSRRSSTSASERSRLRTPAGSLLTRPKMYRCHRVRYSVDDGVDESDHLAGAL